MSPNLEEKEVSFQRWWLGSNDPFGGAGGGDSNYSGPSWISYTGVAKMPPILGKQNVDANVLGHFEGIRL